MVSILSPARVPQIQRQAVRPQPAKYLVLEYHIIIAHARIGNGHTNHKEEKNCIIKFRRFIAINKTNADYVGTPLNNGQYSFPQCAEPILPQPHSNFPAYTPAQNICERSQSTLEYVTVPLFKVGKGAVILEKSPHDEQEHNWRHHKKESILVF